MIKILLLKLYHNARNIKYFIQLLYCISAVEDHEQVYPNILIGMLDEQQYIRCNTHEEVRWYHSKGRVCPNTLPISTNPHLIIQDVAYSDAGFYFCYGTYKGSSKHFLAKADLRVYGWSSKVLWCKLKLHLAYYM